MPTTTPASSGSNPAWRPEPCGIVIFGATGDLTARKLIPALYNLARLKRLPENFYVLGLARREWTQEKFREQMQAGVQEHGPSLASEERSVWEDFVRRLHYQPLDAKDPAAFQQLAKRLEQLDREHGVLGNCVFYLAVAPGLYAVIAEHLGQAGLAAAEANSEGWRRIIFEKPFGHDLESARRLNAQIRAVFGEQQIYRIDHYLGKETVQNLAVVRFANGIFEPIWNRNFIDNVQITVAEDLGVEGRAGFYEGAGAVRDMIQNHLLQVLCLTAMEPPSSFEADPVRQEKLKVLQAIHPLSLSQLDLMAARGQYGPGRIGERKVPGYREEEGVRADSPTETFAALKLEIDNWRWAGVPFYLRTGKRLAKKSSQVAIQFRDAPLHLFACTPMGACEPNLLTLRLQPDEGIDLRFVVKQPGLQVVGEAVEMDFSYGGSLKAETPTGYETLLLDCLEGDSMLFSRGDWVERAWQVLDPLLVVWAENPPADFPNYASGTWGPAAAQALVEREGRRWHLS